MNEVTKEFFYSIINSGDRNTEVKHTEYYTDVIYIKHGVKMVYRSQWLSGTAQYYVCDINK